MALEEMIMIGLAIIIVYLLVLLTVGKLRYIESTEEYADGLKEAKAIVGDAVADMNQMVDDSGKVLAIAELLAELHLAGDDEILIALNQKFYELPEYIWTQLPKTGEIAGTAPEPDNAETGGGGDYYDD